MLTFRGIYDRVLYKIEKYQRSIRFCTFHSYLGVVVNQNQRTNIRLLSGDVHPRKATVILSALLVLAIVVIGWLMSVDNQDRKEISKLSAIVECDKTKKSLGDVEHNLQLEIQDAAEKKTTATSPTPATLATPAPEWMPPEPQMGGSFWGTTDSRVLKSFFSTMSHAQMTCGSMLPPVPFRDMEDVKLRDITPEVLTDFASRVEIVRNSSS
jgi:hypothetical protein